jgi:hypothetical protein
MNAAKAKKFALECREVRLFIAQNPATNSFAIKERFKHSVDRHLSKMLGMGIIKVEDGHGGGTGLFYVVPQ